MPVASLVLSTVFHVSIIFAVLWSLPTTSTPLMPEDAIELTIERQTASLAAVTQSVAIPAPPVDSPPIQPALPVPRQPGPQVDSLQTPTLENAVPEPQPAPELTLRDFPKAEAGPQVDSEQPPTLENAVPEPQPAPELTQRDFPKAGSVVRKIEEKKPSPKSDPPKSDPKPDLNKAFQPPPGGTLPDASPPTPLPNRADVVQPNKKSKDYLERMGITPSHQAILTEKSGDTCRRVTENYKLEITDNKLTVTNQHGVMFSIKVSANGEIYQRFKRVPTTEDSNPFRFVHYEMIGNVKTGKLELWQSHCVYRLNLYR